MRSADAAVTGKFEHSLPANRHPQLSEDFRHSAAALKAAGPKAQELSLKVRILDIREVAQDVYFVALDVRAELYSRHQREARVARSGRTRLAYTFCGIV